MIVETYKESERKWIINISLDQNEREIVNAERNIILEKINDRSEKEKQVRSFEHSCRKRVMDDGNVSATKERKQRKWGWWQPEKCEGKEEKKGIRDGWRKIRIKCKESHHKYKDVTRKCLNRVNLNNI